MHTHTRGCACNGRTLTQPPQHTQTGPPILKAKPPTQHSLLFRRFHPHTIAHHATRKKCTRAGAAPHHRRTRRRSRPPHDAVTRTDGEARPRQDAHRLANTHSHRLRTEATSTQPRSPNPDSVQSPHTAAMKRQRPEGGNPARASRRCTRRQSHKAIRRITLQPTDDTPPTCPPRLQARCRGFQYTP